MNEYELYYWDTEDLIKMFSPKAFKGLIIHEVFDLVLYDHFIELLFKFEDMEEYRYCAAIMLYLNKYRSNYDNI